RRKSGDDLIERVDDPRELLGRGDRETAANALHSQRADLADLDPGSLRQARGVALERERKAGPRLLARQSDGDDGSGPLVEDVVAQDQHRAEAGLLPAAYRVQAGPADLASQYSGHVSRLPARPSSASAFSSFGSSLAHSAASRVRAIRWSFSASAASMAWLRFRKR